MSTDVNNDADDQVERALLAALSRRADVGESSSEDDEALISAAVTAHLETVQPAAALPPKARKSAGPWLAGVGLLAAAAAAALWLIPSSPSDTGRDATTLARVPAASDTPTQAIWMLEGKPVQGMTTATTREACGTRNSTRACLAPGSRGSFEADGSLQLHRGSAQVEAQEPIILFLPAAQLSLTSDAANFTATYEADAWKVQVASGTLTLTGADGVPRVLEAGDAATQTLLADADTDTDRAEDSVESAPTQPDPGARASKEAKPTPSADALLTLAREQRTAKDFAAAARSYEQLVSSYPESTKARAALVSLAQLYQGPLGDPAKALRHFDSYLLHGGPLAEDAHVGKIRALRSLGRSAKASDEVEAFLLAYPSSAHADALRDGSQ